MRPNTRRTLLVAIVGLLILAVGLCVFDERASRAFYDGPEFFTQEAP